MKGEAVPLVLIPRYTTYAGTGEFTTAPLDVSAYGDAVVTFWRGTMLQGPGAASTFTANFQGSHDAVQWEDLGSPIATVDAVSTQEIELTRRWFRVRVLIDDVDPDAGVAITLWATGLLERRIA